MGLKDNFSQAVKELWKKDGQEGEKPQGDREPSELDKYLREQGGGEQPVSAQRPVQGGEVTSNGVPLETPYYPNKEPAQNNVNTQSSAPNTQDVRSADAQPDDMSQDGQSVNRNAMNAMSNPNAANTANTANVDNSANPANFANSANTANFQDNQPNDSAYNQNVRSISQNFGQNARNDGYNQGGYNQGGYNQGGYNQGGYNQGGYNQGGYNQGGYNRNMGNGDMGNMGNGGMNGRFVQPPSGNSGAPAPMGSESEETTIISKNTQIEGNIHSLANMTVDGNIKGNLETTRNVDMTGKIIGDIIANNAAMNSAAMQGNISLKGRMKMDRDTILIGDLSSQYADINGRIRGKLDIVGKAELKRDAIVFGDINASTIAVTDGAIIQGYVNTTFLSKDDSRNVFPDAISIEEQKGGKSNSAPNQGMGNADANPTS